MSGHAHDVPRVPLAGAVFLVVFTLIAASFVRITGSGGLEVPDAPIVAERWLTFEDRDDGSIAVVDARANARVAVVPPASNGFLRGTLRGLARERKRQGIGEGEPFRLAGRADGRLTLIDPATGRRVDLEAFGPDNAGAFLRLLAAEGGAG